MWLEDLAIGCISGCLCFRKRPYHPLLGKDQNSVSNCDLGIKLNVDCLLIRCSHYAIEE